MSLIDLSLLSFTEIIGDFKLKDYARTNNITSLFQGLGGYCFVIYFLIKSLRRGNVTYVNGMWDGLSAIFETICAYYLLGETLNDVNQYVGLLMICIGSIVLHWGGIAS
jgi:multidrug transporter EmrE-like cation transporter